MHWSDRFRYAATALGRHGLRTAMVVLAMGIGVAAIVLLTSLGEGARRYVTGEFASLGTNLLIVIPGRTETAGFAPGLIMGTTPRDLTIGDAEALRRSTLVRRVSPLVVGSAAVSRGGRERDAVVIGATADYLAMRRWHLASGRFLPALDPRQAAPVCVLGHRIRRELFASAPALGRWLRIGDRRCRVIGILAPEGESLGIDVDELLILPVASAQSLFNTSGLFRILVEARSRAGIEPVRSFIERTIARRHQGELDVTVITQDAVLGTFDRILGALTLVVAAIAAVSLGVAGILVMNVMLVSVHQRTGEIGLLKAVGASRREIAWLFLTEALLLSLAGALAGLAAGNLGDWVLARLYPALPWGSPAWAQTAALAVALATGMVFGVHPARRAARLDPVAALSGA